MKPYLIPENASVRVDVFLVIVDSLIAVSAARNAVSQNKLTDFKRGEKLSQ